MLMTNAGPSDAIPAVPSRLGAMSAADREAAMRKAKEAGMPRFNPAMGPQTGVMAMRAGDGGVAKGADPAMQTGTVPGERCCQEIIMICTAQNVSSQVVLLLSVMEFPCTRLPAALHWQPSC